ncbi:hypothetical protein PTKU15_94480 (plasmid) [Paraburkholderia terrae]|nr:hypothetical protein PTKU15_94480 [Paraburkholderia terrae]
MYQFLTALLYQFTTARDTKPEKAVRDLMKRNAFVFSPTRSPVGKSAYVRKLTPNAIATAKWLRPRLDELMTDE